MVHLLVKNIQVVQIGVVTDQFSKVGLIKTRAWVVGGHRNSLALLTQLVVSLIDRLRWGVASTQGSRLGRVGLSLLINLFDRLELRKFKEVTSPCLQRTVVVAAVGEELLGGFRIELLSRAYRTYLMASC